MLRQLQRHSLHKRKNNIVLLNSTKLNTKAKTTYKNIKSEILKYSIEKGIGEDDVLLLFISSHGMLVGNKFYLIPSDLQGGKPLTIASEGTNFEADILSNLEEINCTKILLVDACYSEGGLQKILKKVKNQDKILAIASSQADQRSYEDEAWEHGAFTAAILKAFDGEGVKKLDTNGDSVVNDKEFYDFVKKEVQEMVWKAKRKEADSYND